MLSPNDTGITFEDIGALDNVKETLRELVMLPLQRPELFSKGQLRKVFAKFRKGKAGLTYLSASYWLHLEVLPTHFFLAACEGNTALWTSWNR